MLAKPVKRRIPMEKENNNHVWINAVLLVLFLGFMAYISFKYGKTLIELSKDPELLREKILFYGRWSILALIGAQVVQVVIAFIPGEIVQMMGGYIFGPVLGTLYSLAGITLGAAIVFFIVKITGYPLVRTFVPEKYMKKLMFLTESKKGQTAMFILFLIPGIPKDILVYMAGLTPIKPSEFFVIYVIARLPALAASCWFGSSLYERNYVKAAVISAVVLVFFAIGFKFKDRIVNRLQESKHGNNE